MCISGLTTFDPHEYLLTCVFWSGNCCSGLPVNKWCKDICYPALCCIRNMQTQGYWVSEKAFAYYQQCTARITKRIWPSPMLHCIWWGCTLSLSYGSAHTHQVSATIFTDIWDLVLFMAVQYVMRGWWSHWQFWLAAYFEVLSQHPLTSEGNSDRWRSHHCSSYCCEYTNIFPFCSII